MGLPERATPSHGPKTSSRERRGTGGASLSAAVFLSLVVPNCGPGPPRAHTHYCYSMVANIVFSRFRVTVNCFLVVYTRTVTQQ